MHSAVNKYQARGSFKDNRMIDIKAQAPKDASSVSGNEDWPSGAPLPPYPSTSAFQYSTVYHMLYVTPADHDKLPYKNNCRTKVDCTHARTSCARNAKSAPLWSGRERIKPDVFH